MLMAFGALVFVNDFSKIGISRLSGCKHGVIDDLLPVSVGQAAPTGKYDFCFIGDFLVTGLQKSLLLVKA